MGIDPLDIVIHIINIVVLFILLRVLLYKPVKKFLDARKARVAGELADAERAKSEAEDAKFRAEESLSSVKQTADRAADEIIRKANAEAEEIIGAAKREAEDILADAAGKAEETRKKALDDARDELAGLSLAMAEKILSREVNEEDNRRIIDLFLDAAKKGDA